MTKKVHDFFIKHGFISENYEVENVSNLLLKDMQKGLDVDCEKNPSNAAEQDMIPCWMGYSNEKITNDKVIVIDAGGTNFRSCVVNFDSNGNYEVSDFEKTSMPGIGREYSKPEFFEKIAGNLEHLKDKADKIAFCFSYAMKITPDHDGIVINLAKEIKANAVKGSRVGYELSNALVARGWKRPKKIVVLNDSAAALLAGNSLRSQNKKFSSYVGLILGTGLNAAYVESGEIAKIKEEMNSHCDEGKPAIDKQIVVCETGKFTGIKQSEFDKELDEHSLIPGMYPLEKQCSGAYLGKLCLIAIKKALEDGLFESKDAVKIENAIKGLDKLELKDISEFLGSLDGKGGFLEGVDLSIDDVLTLHEICDAFIERSARLAAGIVAANIMKAKCEGYAFSSLYPVCISCDGTTFLKTYKLRERFTHFLYSYITEKQGINFEVVTIENPITIGTAMAAFC